MDFMKWINSLDELLYEVMSWLVFFPITLWRTLTRPIVMMDYADRQLQLPDEAQYAAALSPPLFLTLSLLLAHGISMVLGQSDRLVDDRHGLSGLINDETSALVLRLIVFSAFPLAAALRRVRRSGQAIDRGSLRRPFYAQCYPGALFALGLSTGLSLAALDGPIAYHGGVALIVGTLLHYAATQTRWFAVQLEIGTARAMGAAFMVLFEGFVTLLMVGFLFSR